MRGPTAQAVALVHDLITARDPLHTNAYGQTISRVIERAKNTFLQVNPSLNRELEEVAAILRREMDSKRSELFDLRVRAYTTRLSEQELKDLLLFYKSPLGRKWNVVGPQLVEDFQIACDRWAYASGGGFMETVNQRFRTEMQKKGHPI
jgi:uncharacterized protein